jgi:hypothetical protein
MMRRFYLCLFLLLSATANAATVTIDFEELAGGPYSGVNLPASLPTKGYTLERSASPPGFGENGFPGGIGPAVNGVPDPVSGTELLSYCASTFCGTEPFVFTLSNASSLSFSLHSLDFASNSSLVQLQVVGYLSAGGTLNASMFADGAGWQTLVLGSAWSGLERIELVTAMNAGAYSGGLDNIVVSTVPVPATVWLLSSALAGLGWLRRKQQHI